MLLSIKEMEVRKFPFAKTWLPGEFDLSDSGTIPAVKQSGPLTAEGVAELLPDTGGEVRVQGSVRGELEAECDRCLGRASFPIDATFDLFYSPSRTGPGEEPLEEEVALDEGEVEIGFYDFPGLELEDIVRERLLLQLPMQRVCSDTCKGICPSCGGNRNETACQCELKETPVDPNDPRWKGLRDIHLPDRLS